MLVPIAPVALLPLLVPLVPVALLLLLVPLAPVALLLLLVPLIPVVLHLHHFFPLVFSTQKEKVAISVAVWYGIYQ